VERRHNEALVMFFLKNRLSKRYDPLRDIGPGHPVYERVRRDLEAELARDAPSPVELIAKLERRVEAMQRESSETL